MIECRSATTTTVNESEKKFHLRGITSKTFTPRSIQNNLEMIMILLILAAVFANKVQESVFMPANGQLLWTTGRREKK
jgi:retron-type reverse transcriptase